jgi:hypothetical protein
MLPARSFTTSTIVTPAEAEPDVKPKQTATPRMTPRIAMIVLA